MSFKVSEFKMIRQQHSNYRLELAAEKALGAFDSLLEGVDHREDPVPSVGHLLVGLKLLCMERAGGSEQLWHEAVAEMWQLADFAQMGRGPEL